MLTREFQCLRTIPQLALDLRVAGLQEARMDVFLVVAESVDT